MGRSVLIACGFGLAAGQLAAPAVLSAQPMGRGWSLSCRAGTDGFASNCTATRASGRATLEVRTADSQVFAMIRHPRCQTNYRNFDRTDLAGQTRSQRNTTITRAFVEIQREFRRTCPSVTVPALNLGGMPDLTIHPNRSEP